jgi:hypothetical protein
MPLIRVFNLKALSTGAATEKPKVAKSDPLAISEQNSANNFA